MLFDKDGKPLNPPPFPGSPDDPGLLGVNYKNEPMQFRLGPDCDPAYVLVPMLMVILLPQYSRHMREIRFEFVYFKELKKSPIALMYMD